MPGPVLHRHSMGNMTPPQSRRMQLLMAVAIQGIGALVVLATNAYLLDRLGGATYQKLATLLSIFVAANYFDFGYLGRVRIAAASSGLTDAGRRQVLGRLFWAFTTRIAVFELGLWLLVRLTNIQASFLAQVALVLAIAPFVVHVNGLRAFLEGKGALIAASLLRSGFGILVGISPLIALKAMGDPLSFAWLIAGAALVLTLVFFAMAIRWVPLLPGTSGEAEQTLPRSQAIALLETTYVLAGAVFLYADRYALMALENSARAGTYLFVLELVSRVSLLYVPVVMQAFPQLMAHSEREPAAARALLRSTDGKVCVLVVGALGFALAVAALLNGHVRTSVDWTLAMSLAVPLSLAYAFNGSSYLHQRFTTLTHERARPVMLGYAGLVALSAAAFWILYRLWGVSGVAVAFLLRTLAENLLLRWTLRPGHASTEQPG